MNVTTVQLTFFPQNSVQRVKMPIIYWFIKCYNTENENYLIIVANVYDSCTVLSILARCEGHLSAAGLLSYSMAGWSKSAHARQIGSSLSISERKQMQALQQVCWVHSHDSSRCSEENVEVSNSYSINCCHQMC